MEKVKIKGNDNLTTIGNENINIQGDNNTINLMKDIFPNPIAFDPGKLKNLIESFLDIDYFNNLKICEEELFQHFRRKPDFINKKNLLNGISKDYYLLIEEEYQEHFSDINNFLGNSRNNLLRKRYRLIAKRLNISYLAKYKNEKNLPEHIQFVMNIVYNNIAIISDDVDFYLSIFLHHMYFYCDYGVNPKI